MLIWIAPTNKSANVYTIFINNFSLEIKLGWCAWKGSEEIYEKSKARVRVCREEGSNFEVTVGLRQECVMSPWWFNFVYGWG